MKQQRIAFHTLGCKLNFSETSTISRSPGGEDFIRVGFSDIADIYVINSCTVTKNAEKRCKSLIRQAMKRNPEARIAVIGCYAQLHANDIQSMPGVKLVLGNEEKYRLFERIRALQETESFDRQETNSFPWPSEKQTAKEDTLNRFFPSWSKDDRTRSFFKIQDGCDYRCTYCSIPLARGHSRSDTIAGTIKTAHEIARTNIREIVLSGVNIGDFGSLHNERFIDLLRELVKVEGIERIRISSVEPDLLHEDIIRLVADNPKLMPHFHIPLQSGSDKVLRAMGRRYDTALFSRQIDTIRRLIPLACIAADLIVGFPAETDDLFNESFQFTENTAVSYMHVFTYSERENTRASGIRQAVTVIERHRRSKIMHALSAQKKESFYLANKGEKAIVLWEADHHDGFMYGFTENYIRVKTPYQADLVNNLQTLWLNITDEDGVYLI